MNPRPYQDRHMPELYEALLLRRRWLVEARLRMTIIQSEIDAHALAIDALEDELRKRAGYTA